MQITNSALPNDAAALSEAAASGVVVPYNAPTANDFEQVLRSVTPPTSGAATTTTPAATMATPPRAMPATSASIPTATTPTAAATPSAAASPYPYAGAYGAMMPAMYVPMMMPMAMMPATGSGATTTATGGTAATGTPAVAGTVAPTGMPAVAGTPMAMAMVPMAMVPMGMMPMAGAPAMAGTTSTTSGAATTAAAVSTPGTTTAAASTGSTAAGTFRLPFQGTPQITQPFGPTAYAAEPAYAGYSHFHTGIDFALPTGTAVDAAGSGTVVAAGWDNTGFGNRVIIDHGNGVQTLYGHLSKVEVGAGQTIQAGQELGLSGSTGNSSGPHLHFGVEQNGRWVDPAPYLSGSVSTPAATDGATPASSVAGDPAAIGGGAATTVSPSSLPALVRQVAAQTGVSASLISAVVQAESAGNPHAVSSAGAKGLMQLMDATAAEYGVTDSFDPQQNVTAGAKYLAHLLSEFDGNQQLAVAAYNAGPGAVQQYGGIPPYPETQAYVQKVTALQQQYAASNGA